MVELPYKANRVYCGIDSTFLLQDDCIWACGANGFGHLGTGHVSQMQSFGKVVAPLNSKNVKSMASMRTCTIFLESKSDSGC